MTVANAPPEIPQFGTAENKKGSVFPCHYNISLVKDSSNNLLLSGFLLVLPEKQLARKTLHCHWNLEKQDDGVLLNIYLISIQTLYWVVQVFRSDESAVFPSLVLIDELVVSSSSLLITE